MSIDETKLREWLEERLQERGILGGESSAFVDVIDWLDDNASPAPVSLETGDGEAIIGAALAAHRTCITTCDGEVG